MLSNHINLRKKNSHPPPCMPGGTYSPSSSWGWRGRRDGGSRSCRGTVALGCRAALPTTVTPRSYNTIQRNTTQYNTMQHNTIHYNKTLLSRTGKVILQGLSSEKYKIQSREIKIQINSLLKQYENINHNKIRGKSII